MIVRDVLAILVGVAVVVLPGASLLLALGVRRPLWYAAVPAVASVGVALVTAVICALVGLPFGVATLGVVTLVLSVVGVLRLLKARRADEEPRKRVRLGLGGLLGLGFVLCGMGLGGAIWMAGIDTLSTISQEHDMIMHYVITSYIERTGDGAPWQLMPTDLATGEGIAFYPAGLHLLMAVSSALTGGAAVGINAVTIAVLAFGWATSIASLAFVAARRAGIGRDGAMIAGGIASIVASGLYRPVFSLIHEGGVLPNAATLVLAPGLIAALLTIPRKGWGPVVAIAFSCLGILAIHPSAMATVGVSLIVWWIGEAFTRGGLRRILGQLPRIAAAGGIAVVIGLPLLVKLFGVSGGAPNAPADSPAIPFGDALGNSLGMIYWGFVMEHRAHPQLAAAVITLVGAAAVLYSRKGLGVFAAWLAWVVIEVAYWTSPGKGWEAIITGLFYHSNLRVWSHISLFAPVLGAVGVVLIATRVALWLGNRAPALRRRVRLVSVGLAFAMGFVYLAWPAVNYARIEADYIANRYARPNFVRVGVDDGKAIAWLGDKIKPGERVLNSANDGSTFLYVDEGIPIINLSSLGNAKLPYTYRLMKSFNTYPSNPDVRKMLKDLNIRWVYVDTSAPLIGAATSPEDWLGDKKLFSFPPGFEDLDGLPGLEKVFTSGPVSIYEIDASVLNETS